jgi:flagellar protein FlaG
MTTSVSLSTAVPSQGPPASKAEVSKQSTDHQSRGPSVEQVSARITEARSSKAPSVHESARITKESVEVAGEKIRSFASSMNRNLDIRFDNVSHSTVMVVRDSQSNEVVRQIPAPEVVELARTIDYLASLLVNKKA